MKKFCVKDEYDTDKIIDEIVEKNPVYDYAVYLLERGRVISVKG